VSPGHALDTNLLYGVGFGNNKHLAAGFCAGLNFDFVDTVEVGGEFGYTHFFEHSFDCYRIPNSKLQNNIFPFVTSVNINPGHNTYFAFKLSARHFLERLSGYFQYVMLEHEPDCIQLCTPDPAFVPDVLSRKTGFKVQLANIGFTYDLTPNIAAGFLWQAPWSQRGAARSSTIMGCVTATF
jgi:hypothetical protein